MPYVVVGVLVLVVVGIVAILALARLRPGNATDPSRRAGMSSTASLGMSIGLLLGGLLGALVWISTGQYVFWVVFVGGGLSTGLAIGTALASRSR